MSTAVATRHIAVEGKSDFWTNLLKSGYSSNNFFLIVETSVLIKSKSSKVPNFSKLTKSLNGSIFFGLKRRYNPNPIIPTSNKINIIFFMLKIFLLFEHS